MGDAKHTPGPWEAVEPTAIDYRAMQIQTAESLIAVCCGGGPKRAISAPEERANARLIAAAPDMSDALRAARTYLMDVSKDRGDAARGTLEIINAALSKAEGE